MTEILERFSSNLATTQNKNAALLLILEGGLSDIKGLESHPLLQQIYEALSECIKPNQTLLKELDSLFKLLDAKIADVTIQEKQNELQIKTLEGERRQLILERRTLEEEKSKLTTDKEKAEQKLDTERGQLLARAKKLTEISNQLEVLPKDLDTEIIYQAEKEKLKSELGLMQKIEEVKGLEAIYESYQEQIKKVGDNTRDAIKVSEKQATEACKRIAQMNKELIKSQATSRKLQHLLQLEQEQNQELRAELDHERLQPISKHLQQCTLKGQSIDENLATIPGLSKALINRAAKSGSAPTALKVEELLRRNELLKEEVNTLRTSNKGLEQQLILEKDNCKKATTNLHIYQTQASTLRGCRDEALRKLKRVEREYNQLNKGCTRQAASWIQTKTDERLTENDAKISKLLPNA